PGQEYVFTKTVAMKSTTTFLFTLTGRSGGGSELEAPSNPLTVAVTPVVEDIALKLIAEFDQPPPGTSECVFRLTVRNQGELDIRDVHLSERERGPIKTLAVVAPGDTVIEQRYTLTGPAQFTFMAEMTDAKGGRLTVLSSALDVPVDGIDPVDASARYTPAPAAMLDGMGGTRYTLPNTAAAYTRMTVGVLLVLLVLGTCVFATWNARRRKKRRLRDRHLRKMRRNYRREQHEDKRQQTRAHPIVKQDTMRRERPVLQQEAHERRPGSVRRPGTARKRDKGRI
ncbi:MAG: hypothetical protein RR843_04170, partial [Clostridia bacterium]